MKPDAQQPEHCGREVGHFKCMVYDVYFEETKETERPPCNIFSDCPNDTRTRPHPPAPELIGEMEDMRKELEMLRTEHYENLLKPTPEQAARAATLATLDDICENCGGLADGGEQCKNCYVKARRQQAGDQ